MIPKTIHYCWFGKGEKPKLAKKCVESWKKYCPDYEIIEWNENNFDVYRNPYTRMCYEQRKFAFLSDYVRLIVVEQHGGVYLDTDVELLKPLDSLLQNEAYVGFENDNFVNTGEGFGSVAHGKMVQTMLAEYDELLDGQHGTTGCPILNTQALEKLGMQKTGKIQQLDSGMVYPADWFNPYDDPTGRLNTTKNTMSIHWYSKSWMSKGTILRSRLSKPLHRLQDMFRKGQ